MIAVDDKEGALIERDRVDRRSINQNTQVAPGGLAPVYRVRGRAPSGATVARLGPSDTTVRVT